MPEAPWGELPLSPLEGFPSIEDWERYSLYLRHLGFWLLLSETINAEDLLAVTAYLVPGSRNFLRNVCLSFPLRHGQLRKVINAVFQRLSKSRGAQENRLTLVWLTLEPWAGRPGLSLLFCSRHEKDARHGRGMVCPARGGSVVPVGNSTLFSPIVQIRFFSQTPCFLIQNHFLFAYRLTRPFGRPKEGQGQSFSFFIIFVAARYPYCSLCLGLPPIALAISYVQLAPTLARPARPE
ncbi:hypothetical protein KSP39_PZI016218 [Platanthera zijinensis]|uniref:Uncharacterized protein n=1 Tax=Platanthera zijinensis TaxID=2320716 RepID=A0AAP0G073_9ASPA